MNTQSTFTGRRIDGPSDCIRTSDFASLAHYYLEHDSGHDVVAFTVTRDFLPSEPNFEDKPVVPFEELETVYSPDEFWLLAPLSPRGMNRVREQIFPKPRHVDIASSAM